MDELGYIPLDRIGAEYLFGFFSLCYELTSVMVTTNLPFTDWPQIFANDERLAGAFPSLAGVAESFTRERLYIYDFNYRPLVATL